MYIDDEYIKFRKRIANLRKQFPQNNNSQYNYIFTSRDLLDAWIDKLADLDYPLRVEPKRDRFVMNTQAMKEALEQATTEALNMMEADIVNWIQSDVYKLIQQTAQDAINNVVSFGASSPSNSSKKTKSLGARLGEAFGKKLAQTIWHIFDDMVKTGR